jgi:hypothetical protein
MATKRSGTAKGPTKRDVARLVAFVLWAIGRAEEEIKEGAAQGQVLGFLVALARDGRKLVGERE